MPRVVKQDILRFQVSIDDLEAMKTFEGTEKFSRVEARTSKVEALLFLEVVEQLSAIDEGKDEVELLRRLEGELERDDEGIVDLGKY